MAPDYVLIERSRQDEFVEELRKVYDLLFSRVQTSFGSRTNETASRYEDFWPAADGGARGSDSLSRIVNERQFDRLKGMLDKTDGKVVLGGECVREELYVAPTVVKDCTGDDSLLAEYVFCENLFELLERCLTLVGHVARSLGRSCLSFQLT